MSVVLKELRESLELLPISEVRSRASKNFGLKLNKDHTKEDIINLIVGMASKSDYAKAATDNLPEPGWSRIQAFPVPGRSTFPFYVGLNGYFIWIPYNVKVDVPTKILGVLNDAQEMMITTDEFGNQTRTLQASYPYQLIHTTPGPDPRPGFEVGRERKIAAKRAFAEKHGYWPKNADIKEAKQAAILKDAIHGTSDS